MADKSGNMVIAPPGPSPAAPFAAATSDTPSRVQDAATRWAALPGGLIDGGEVVILAIKPSLWRPLFDSAAWLALTIVLALWLTWLGRPLPGLSVTASAQVFLLIGFGRLGWAIAHWIPTWYVLTNRRMIEIHGVRRPHIFATPLLEIRNTYLTTTPTEKMTRLGTLTYVSVDAAVPPRQWRTIGSPEVVHAEIRRAIENAIDAHPGA